MMLTIEKVITLKSVSFFSEVPEDSLVEVAAVLEEVECAAGSTIFKQGDLGTSLYVIVTGKVRIHLAERDLVTLGERQVFGELAALDPEPRSADATALEDCLLFRLDRDSLYELMSEHLEVAQGVIRVLCQRLRKSN
jgi:CRP-like cAMP-binding protein